MAVELLSVLAVKLLMVLALELLLKLALKLLVQLPVELLAHCHLPACTRPPLHSPLFCPTRYLVPVTSYVNVNVPISR